MTDVTWNPGEPLFDPATRDFVEVDGEVVFPEDDGAAIANASWYRVMTQRGDCPRDAAAGIDRGMELFNPELPLAVGLGAVRAEIADTPGVTSVSTVEVLAEDPVTRAVYIAYSADTRVGEAVTGTANLTSEEQS
ncbi:MAG: hypothetical protein JNK56_14200 [Myxococcales bacterium]|nr:hypothetical protein [Myxococcales bacterium]